MIARLTLGLVFLLAMGGCASTQKKTSVSQLQLQVGNLEAQLREKDQELSDLRDEIDDLTQEVRKDGDAAEARESLQEYSSASFDKKGIIRVTANPSDIQQALKNAGYYDGAIDSKIGHKTKKAISAFQADHGLKADGIIGKRTWAELSTYLK